MAVHVVLGRYFRDLLAQPEALAETVESLDRARLETVVRGFAEGRYRRIVLTGMGSSFHGLVPLQLRLIAAGHAPLLVETSELLYQASDVLARGTLLVAVSQSGRSGELVRLLDALPAGVEVLGVTNTPGSPLERAWTAGLLTRAGEEATVSCKTYLAAQAALAFAGAALTGDDTERLRRELASAVPLVEGYLLGWHEHVDSLEPVLRDVRALFYAGRGASLAAAGTAGLITKEATRRPAEGLSSAALRHGPMEMLGAGVFVLVFAGDARTRALNERLVAAARAAGARAFLADEQAEEPAFRLPPVPESARALVEILPAQMVTLALAAIDGREAGRFEHASKVTTTE